MSSNDGNGNITADGLIDYLRHGSNDDHDGSSPPSEIVRRHALERLIESRLGADVTAAARRSVADEADPSSPRRSDEGWRAAADRLAETPSFRELLDAVEECAARLPPPGTAAGGGDGNADAAASKKAKLPEAVSVPAAPALTSFSLFDMLDSQKGTFALPPRITAHKIIEAHRREKNATATTGDSDCTESTLELLEKADDMEDLSPDPESWEDVRTILYEGLLSSSRADGADDASSRYLKVHESLREKCGDDGAFGSQRWGLAHNLIAALLTLSRAFEKDDGRGYASKPSMDLCWDIALSLLDALAHLAVDHVVSCVGNEREVERMFLGICFILSNDFAACVVAMMEPMAGHFEVWTRFVSPKRCVTCLRISGLGGAALRRCENFGRTSSSEGIWNTMQKSLSGGGECSVSLADIEHCNFLQSLSILRIILFGCGGSREVVDLVHNQFAGQTKEPVALSSFLLPHGVASPDDVQTLLDEVEEGRQKHDRTRHPGDAVDVVLKPFRGVLRAKESDDGLVGRDLEVLCTQTVQLMQRSR